MLNNPRYAGAYAYGRRHYRRAADGRKVLQQRQPADWLACIPGAHPSYISWEQFQHNLEMLEAKGMSRAVLKFAQQALSVEQAMPPRPAVQDRG